MTFKHTFQQTLTNVSTQESITTNKNWNLSLCLLLINNITHLQPQATINLITFFFLEFSTFVLLFIYDVGYLTFSSFVLPFLLGIYQFYYAFQINFWHYWFSLLNVCFLFHWFLPLSFLLPFFWIQFTVCLLFLKKELLQINARSLILNL